MLIGTILILIVVAIGIHNGFKQMKDTRAGKLPAARVGGSSWWFFLIDIDGK
jgi:hypothetical protein